MSETVIKENIVGSRNTNSIIVMLLLLCAGLGFFLAGLSSKIIFIPQGIVMLFYGTGAIGIGLYILFTIIWNVGSGYNEFSKDQQTVRIVRLGFPGKNRTIFLSYEFQNLKNLKFVIKQGLNPRCNILMVLKDKREIPLFPAQFLLNPKETESKAINLSNFLNIPLEVLVV